MEDPKFKKLIELLKATPDPADDEEAWRAHDEKIRAHLKECGIDKWGDSIHDKIAEIDEPTDECEREGPGDFTEWTFEAAKHGVAVLDKETREHFEDCAFCQGWFLFYVHELRKNPDFVPLGTEPAE